jgi:hypothetical protein
MDKPKYRRLRRRQAAVIARLATLSLSAYTSARPALNGAKARLLLWLCLSRIAKTDGLPLNSLIMADFASASRCFIEIWVKERRRWSYRFHHLNKALLSTTVV